MKCAVLGDPIAHSLSPVLHRAGYAAVGLDWEYDAAQVPAGELAGFVRGLGRELARAVGDGSAQARGDDPAPTSSATASGSSARPTRCC